MAPIVDRLKQKYRGQVTIEVMNIDNSPGKEESQKYNVSAIPTFVFFDKNGNQVDTVTGGMDETTFEAKIKSLLE